VPTVEENELLTQTGPGTPMGELFRRFWLPAMLPDELPGPDCDPVRIRILSEDLVAFRDSSGRIGILGAHCPHRGASLFFGRNEENGLRCVYHGWKYDVDGRCIDMPSEPPESTFKDRIRATAYAAREWGGLIWVYLGPKDRTPELPQLEWACLPPEQRRVGKWIQDVNYLQCLEGEIDTSHVGFLHSSLTPSNVPNKTTRPELLAKDRSPRLIVKETDSGFLYGARRTVGEGTYYWRVTQWLMPTYSIIPSAEYPLGGRLWVPADDTHTWSFTYSYHPDRALTDAERGGFASGRSFPPELIPGTFRPRRNVDNDYEIDREEQRARTFTGIYGINDQDRAMLDSMGPIVDRRIEHLGTSDLAIITARRRLLAAARDLERGIEPIAAGNGDLYRVRSLDIVAPHDTLDALMDANQPALVGAVIV
jgi:phenylpropionate dioxygenase-like ring-hydroxylating dioxygenase large terminal subunit